MKIVAYELRTVEAGCVAVPSEYEVFSSIVLGYCDGCHRYHCNHKNNEQDTHKYHAQFALPGASVKVFRHYAQPGQVRDSCKPGEVGDHLPVGPLEDRKSYKTSKQNA